MGIYSTYAKKLVNKKQSAFYDNSPQQYIKLDETPAGNVYGFTYVVPNNGVPHHIQICKGDEWDKCHSRFTSDIKCSHRKWHIVGCEHLSNERSECNCYWSLKNKE